LARDGEFLIKRVRNAGKYGYQLQPINVDRLDTMLNRAPTAGQNAIIMGVEVDAVRRPVAYHIWTSMPGLGADPRRTRERVPANEIIHGFIPLEEEQTRGVPWMHAAMRILNDLKGYREAAVIAARIGASKMGVWVTPDGGPPPGSSDGGSSNSEDDYITDVQPGTFDFAPDGYTFKEFNPAYPHDQFDAFCKATLRGVASAIGAAYSTLANDLENVNYSSIRAGVLDERDEWMVIQNVFIALLPTPVVRGLDGNGAAARRDPSADRVCPACEQARQVPRTPLAGPPLAVGGSGEGHQCRSDCAAAQARQSAADRHADRTRRRRHPRRLGRLRSNVQGNAALLRRRSSPVPHRPNQHPRQPPANRETVCLIRFPLAHHDEVMTMNQPQLPKDLLPAAASLATCRSTSALRRSTRRSAPSSSPSRARRPSSAGTATKSWITARRPFGWVA
jgi:hypothetical protein